MFCSASAGDLRPYTSGVGANMVRQGLLRETRVLARLWEDLKTLQTEARK